ncbi:MAG: response regulator [Fibrobacter sp.]|nr:response regulator [Fibrobacter sp.]
MKKILVVDDSKEIRELVRTTLDPDFYKLYEAPNGTKAIEYSRKYNPDLIIMDINMPGAIDGIEATKQIKGYPGTSFCQILILTGSNDHLFEEGKKAGACEYICKPFSPLDLIEKIDQLLSVS